MRYHTFPASPRPLLPSPYFLSLTSTLYFTTSPPTLHPPLLLISPTLSIFPPHSPFPQLSTTTYFSQTRPHSPPSLFTSRTPPPLTLLFNSTCFPTPHLFPSSINLSLTSPSLLYFTYLLFTHPVPPPHLIHSPSSLTSLPSSFMLPHLFSPPLTYSTTPNFHPFSLLPYLPFPHHLTHPYPCTSSPDLTHSSLTSHPLFLFPHIYSSTSQPSPLSLTTSPTLHCPPPPLCKGTLLTRCWVPAHIQVHSNLEFDVDGVYFLVYNSAELLGPDIHSYKVQE